MATTGDIVQRLWSLCHVLRDDGITYQDYVTELTWLLFLKMAREAEGRIPEGYRWSDLEQRYGLELLNFYKKLLLDLGTQTSGRVQQIFVDASTALRQPRNLRKEPVFDGSVSGIQLTNGTVNIGPQTEGLNALSNCRKRQASGPIRNLPPHAGH